MSGGGASLRDRAAAAIAVEPASRLQHSQHPLRTLSLFAGIGGFDLGLERTGGFKTVAFCEIEPFAVRVLNKHWPEVPVYGDVRELAAQRLAADGITVDVICGGFPCQDISKAGRGGGLSGERSGLWSEYARLIAELLPSWVIIENVPPLRSRGLEEVLGTLSALGFDAQWHCVPAAAVGAPHSRDRLWIIANSLGARVEGPLKGVLVGLTRPWGWRGDQDLQALADAPFVAGDRWPQPLLRRVDDGVSARMDRLRCLGNSVVPQIPELIGRAILASIEAERIAA